VSREHFAQLFYYELQYVDAVFIQVTENRDPSHKPVKSVMKQSYEDTRP
jgi:hypothetical protein